MASIPILDIVSDFQAQLTPIKISFEEILTQFNIKNGVTLTIVNGIVKAYIDVEQFRRD